ncbi:hypothetical protein AGMMS49991_11870 [Spirochaetia bacterium]|nr:hypothetical protein AGMMS49991_11870 [Spirochaetia bacterium]
MISKETAKLIYFTHVKIELIEASIDMLSGKAENGQLYSVEICILGVDGYGMEISNATAIEALCIERAAAYAEIDAANNKAKEEAE